MQHHAIAGARSSRSALEGRRRRPPAKQGHAKDTSNMTLRRQQGIPLVVKRSEHGGTVVRLERLPRETVSAEGARYDEQWLQHLIHAHPELLPITEIEPAFEPAIAVCTELPTSRGYIDNFFVTPTGNLLFAECKLWRNPEARRQVVAQVMDYIESLTS